MSVRTKLRTLAILPFGALALAAGSAALANSSNGNQNQDLVVTASLISDGSNSGSHRRATRSRSTTP